MVLVVASVSPKVPRRAPKAVRVALCLKPGEGVVFFVDALSRRAFVVRERGGFRFPDVSGGKQT